MKNPTATPKPEFKIGETVKAVSFTDCFGKVIPEVTGLVVESVRLVKSSVPNDTLKPYYRVKAGCGGLGFVEGAERYLRACVRRLP